MIHRNYVLHMFELKGPTLIAVRLPVNRFSQKSMRSGKSLKIKKGFLFQTPTKNRLEIKAS
jgi:hypothetical protein